MRHRKPDIEFWLADGDLTPNQRYCRFTESLIHAEPFITLSFAAQILYIRMCIQAAGKCEFVYAYSQYRKRMSKSTFMRAKEELIKNGFIQVVECGRNTRTANIYKFCSDWKRRSN